LNPQRHLFASLIVASVSLFFSQQSPLLTVELFGKNITIFILCLFSGVLIDADHIVDFYLNRGQRPAPPETYFKKGRFYVPLHGIENIPVLTAMSILFPFLIFPTISYVIHLILDIFGNHVSHRAYFYLIRLRKTLIEASK
jgi:hypothetical protein